MNINKNFVELYAFLVANQDKQIGDIMDEAVEYMQKETVDKTSRIDEDGVLWIFCWYHKVWESTAEIEYGSKASNKSTGLNTFCKVGVNQWTKQQRDYKSKSAALLEDVATGEMSPDQLSERLKELALERDTIVPRDEYLARKEEERLQKLAAKS